MRIGMKQQWQQPLTALVSRGSATAQHIVVIKAQLEVALGFDDRHDAAWPLLERTQRFVLWAKMHERCPQRIGNCDDEQRSIGEWAEPAVQCSKQIG
jgi:hypothetical protein